MNHGRLVAGMFAGTGALILLYLEHYEAAIAILSSMMSFFVGEQNGKKHTE